MPFVSNRIRAYFYSDYSVDDKYQGYVTRGRVDAHANWGRLTSAIDITSQVGKAFFGTLGSIVLAVGDIVIGVVCIVVLIPTALLSQIVECTGVCYRDGAQRAEAVWLGNKVEFLARKGTYALTGICTIIIGIPFALLWRVYMIMADVIGICLPEVGRKARILDKIGNLTLKELVNWQSLTGLEKEKEEYSMYQIGWVDDDMERFQREGPQYSHDASLRAHRIAQFLIGSIDFGIENQIGRFHGDDSLRIKMLTFKDFIHKARELYIRHGREGQDGFDADVFFYNQLYFPKKAESFH